MKNLGACIILFFCIMASCGFIAIKGERFQQAAGGGGPSALYTAAVAVWDFENDATDTKGTYDLTANNAPTYGTTTPPQGSYYAELSAASSQSFTYADNPAFDLSATDFGIAYWIKRTSATSNQHAVGKYDGGAGNGWRISGGYHSGSDYSDFLRLYSGFSNSEADPGDNGDFITTNWQCITWSFDNDTNTMTVWISESTFGDIANGTTFSGMTVDAAENTSPLYVGGYDATHLLTGSLDEMAIWHQELTATDAQNFFNGTWR